jgi:hypothetical protein
VKNFDSSEIDIRPSLRRCSGGVSDRFVCRKSFGGLESTTASTKVNTNQNQVSVQGGGAGSYTAAAGGGNTVAKKGTLNESVNISADPQVLADAENAVNNSTASAFQFGAETESISAANTGAADATINALAGQITGQASGIDPTTGLPTTNAPAGFDWTKWVNIAFIGGTVISLAVYLRSRGKVS